MDVCGSVGLGLFSDILVAGGGGQLGLQHPSQSHCVLANHLPKTAGLTPAPYDFLIFFFSSQTLLNLLDLSWKGLSPCCQFLCQQSTFHSLSIPHTRARISPEHPGPLFPLGKSPAEQPLQHRLQCTEVFCKLCRRS